MKNMTRRQYERLNHCAFSDGQWQRIESECPTDGIPMATTSGWELALYRMPNGAKFATLVNGSEAVWLAYCAETRVRSGHAQPGDAATALGAGMSETARKQLFAA